MIIAAATRAWMMVADLSSQREYLNRLSQHLKEQLSALGFNTGHTSTCIVPLIIGGEKEANNLQRIFFENKIIAPSIRPPTVPMGTARIRFSLSVLHTMDDISHLIDVLKKL
jgi:8-amino-7-oxononanoate synthase